jgi:cell shape-determining protein MreD
MIKIVAFAIFMSFGVIEIVAGVFIANGHLTWRPDWLLKFMIVGKTKLDNIQKTTGWALVIFGIVEILFTSWFLAMTI